MSAVCKESGSNDGVIHDSISDCGLSSVVHQMAIGGALLINVIFMITTIYKTVPGVYKRHKSLLKASA